jgi:hypothetical protein
VSPACKTCRLWDRGINISPREAPCRRQPIAAPLLVPVGNQITGQTGMGIQVVTCWPLTKPDDWCSHYESAIVLQ